MAKKKKKKRLKIKNILICFITLFIIGTEIYYILTLPINNIYVEGNKILKESEILAITNLDTYPSFLLTSTKKLQRKLQENSYIKNVKIKKTLGNKIYIEIEEYTPICILENENIILSSGEEVKNNYSVTDIPYLIGTLEQENIKNIFIKKFCQVDKDILRQISQIEYKPINVDEERFLLYMDDGNEVYITLTKANKLNKYNEIVKKMEGSHGIIYLDSGDYVEVKDATEIIESSENLENTPNEIEENS